MAEIDGVTLAANDVPLQVAEAKSEQPSFIDHLDNPALRAQYYITNRSNGQNLNGLARDMRSLKQQPGGPAVVDAIMNSRSPNEQAQLRMRMNHSQEVSEFFDPVNNNPHFDTLKNAGLLNQNASVADFYNFKYSLNQKTFGEVQDLAGKHGLTLDQLNTATTEGSRSLGDRAFNTFGSFIQDPGFVGGKFATHEKGLNKAMVDAGVKPEYTTQLFNEMQQNAFPAGSLSYEQRKSSTAWTDTLGVIGNAGGSAIRPRIRPTGNPSAVIPHNGNPVSEGAGAGIKPEGTPKPVGAEPPVNVPQGGKPVTEGAPHNSPNPDKVETAPKPTAEKPIEGPKDGKPATEGAPHNSPNPDKVETAPKPTTEKPVEGPKDGKPATEGAPKTTNGELNTGQHGDVPPAQDSPNLRLDADANAARTQPHGNSASPSPGTDTVGNAGQNIIKIRESAAVRSAVGSARTEALRPYKFAKSDKAAVESRVTDAATDAAAKSYNEALNQGSTPKQAAEAANKAAKSAAKDAADAEAKRFALATDHPHEKLQADRFTELQGGGQFDFGRTKPGIEGYFTRASDGTQIPVSLKDNSNAQSVKSIFREIKHNAKQIVKHENLPASDPMSLPPRTSADAVIHVRAPQYKSTDITDYIKNNASNIFENGVFKEILIDTSDGVVTIDAAKNVTVGALK